MEGHRAIVGWQIAGHLGRQSGEEASRVDRDDRQHEQTARSTRGEGEEAGQTGWEVELS